MTDIIERLETFGDAHSWAVRGDAADEVRRLRAERDQLLAALKLLNNTPNLDNCDPEVWRRARVLTMTMRIVLEKVELAARRNGDAINHSPWLPEMDRKFMSNAFLAFADEIARIIKDHANGEAEDK